MRPTYAREGQPDEGELVRPELSETEEREAGKRSALRAQVVYEAIRREGEGEDELRRSTSALARSGLAAAVSMGFSLVGEGVIRARLPEEPWRASSSSRNTLTGIIPLLSRRSLATLKNVGRLWIVVLIANLAGAVVFSWVVARTG